MPQAIPWIVGAATVGASVYSITSAQKQAKASKNAANDASTQNAAAIQSVKDSQAESSNKAQEAIKRRKSAATQTVYTSPLGLAGQASTARKSLLGE